MLHTSSVSWVLIGTYVLRLLSFNWYTRSPMSRASRLRRRLREGPPQRELLVEVAMSTQPSERRLGNAMFWPSFKNEAKIWLFDTALFLWHSHFCQSGSHSNIYEGQSLTPVLCRSWYPLSGDIFENLEKNNFLFRFCSFIKIIEFTLFLC